MCNVRWFALCWFMAVISAQLKIVGWEGGCFQVVNAPTYLRLKFSDRLNCPLGKFSIFHKRKRNLDSYGKIQLPITDICN